MSFANSILTEDLAPLRQRLLSHPLWTGIEEGTSRFAAPHQLSIQEAIVP